MSGFLETLGAEAYDGDSFRLEEGGTARVTGYDAPEMKPYMGGAEPARGFLQSLLDDPETTTEVVGTDRYDRSLVEMTNRGRDVGDIALMTGAGQPFLDTLTEEQAALAQAASTRRHLPDARTGFDEVMMADREANPVKRDASRLPMLNADQYEGTFERALDRGAANMRLTYGAAAQYLGEKMGFDWLTGAGEKNVKRAMIDAALNPADVGSYEDADGLAEIGTWALEKVGENLPNVASLAVGAGAGALAGRVAAGVGKSILKKAVKDEVSRAVKIGARTGAIAATYPQHLGEGALEMRDAGKPSSNLPFLTAAINTALDVAPMEALLKYSFKGMDPKLSRDIVKEAMREPRVKAALLKVAKGAGFGAATEAPTEFAQELVNLTARATADPEFSWDDPKVTSRLTEAALAGGVVGGAFGASASSVSALVDALNKDWPEEMPPAANQSPGSAAPTPQAEAPALSAPADNSQVIPETPQQIGAQVDAMLDPASSKDTVLVTPGAEVPNVPSAATVDMGPSGTLITTNPEKAATAEQFPNGAPEEVINDALYNGAGSPTKQGDVSVEGRNEAGEIVTQMVADSSQPDQLDSARREAAAQAPTVTEQPVDAAVAERVQQTQQQGPAFEIVPLRFGVEPPQGVIDGHRYKGRDITNAAPGERGWLGNPFVANDVKGGRYTREEAVALYKQALYERAASDPMFAAELQKLRGQKIGYYKPSEKDIHLQAVQQWLAENPQQGHPTSTSVSKKPRKPRAKKDPHSPEVLNASIDKVVAKWAAQEQATPMSQTATAPEPRSGLAETTPAEDVEIGDAETSPIHIKAEGRSATGELVDPSFGRTIRLASKLEGLRAVRRVFAALGAAFRQEGAPGDTEVYFEDGDDPSMSMLRASFYLRNRDNQVVFDAVAEDNGAGLEVTVNMPSSVMGTGELTTARAIMLARAAFIGVNKKGEKAGGTRVEIPARDGVKVRFDLPSLVIFGLRGETTLAKASEVELLDGVLEAMDFLKRHGFEADLNQIGPSTLVAPKRKLTWKDISAAGRRRKDTSRLTSEELDEREIGILEDYQAHESTKDWRKSERVFDPRDEIEEEIGEPAPDVRAFEPEAKQMQASVADVMPEKSRQRDPGAGVVARVGKGVADPRIAEEAAAVQEILQEIGVTLQHDVVLIDDAALAGAPMPSKRAANEGSMTLAQLSNTIAELEEAKRENETDPFWKTSKRREAVEEQLTRLKTMLGAGEYVDDAAGDTRPMTYNEAVLRDAQEQKPAARVMFLERKDGGVAPRIYISDALKGKARAEAIIHEVGHVVMRQFLAGASNDVKAALREAFGEPGTVEFEENFADAFVSYMLKNATRTSPATPAHGRLAASIKGLFEKIKNALRSLLTKANKSLKIDRKWEDFIETLVNRRRRQLGEREEAPATAFGRQLRRALEESGYTNSLTLPKTDISSLDWRPLTAPAKAASLRKAKQLLNTPIGQSGKSAWASVKAFYANWLKSEDSVLREMGNARVTKLADDWRHVPGRDNTHARVRMDDEMRGQEKPFLDRIRSIAEKHVPGWKPWHMLPWVKRPPISDELRQATSELLSGKPQSPLALEIREIFDDLYNWLRDTGIYVPFRKNYFPVMMNQAKLMAEGAKERLEEVVQEWAKTEAAAEWWAKMFDGEVLTAERASTFARHLRSVWLSGQAPMEEDEAGGMSFMAPGFGFRKKRILPPDLIDSLREFREDDVVELLTRYTRAAVRRGMWQKRYGDNEFQKMITHLFKTWPRDLAIAERDKRVKDYIEKWGVDPHDPSAGLKKELLTERRAGRLTQEQLERLNDVSIPSYMGVLGADFHIFGKPRPGFQHFSHLMLVYQTIRVLSLGVLSQVMDVGTMAARIPSGERTRLLKESMKLLSSAGRAELRKDAEILGRWTHDITDHMLNDEVGLQGMSANMSRLNEWFFRANGMHAMTNWARAVDVSIGKQLISLWAEEGDTAKLAELGITPADVRNWEAAGKPLHWSNEHERVLGAINQFVDESIVHPSAPLRPRFGNDRRYMLFFHLKSFTWGFTMQILQRAWEHSKQRWGQEEGLRKFYAALPFITLAAFTMPFAALGMELRWLIAPPKGGEPTGWEYAWETVKRSGNLGLAQFLVDMYETESHGKLSLIAPLGPTVSQFYDFATRDLSSTLPRSLPAYPVLHFLARPLMQE